MVNKTILMDFDDTLVPTHSDYQSLIDEMSRYYDREFNDEFYKLTEERLGRFGYGPATFVITIYRTIHHNEKWNVDDSSSRMIQDWLDSHLEGDIKPFPGVYQALHELKKRGYNLHLYTKGDNISQRRRINNAGLGPFFSQIDVVTEKTTFTLSNYLKVHELSPDELVVVGDSVRSDIQPAHNLGIKPYLVKNEGVKVWSHEEGEEVPESATILDGSNPLGELAQVLSYRMTKILTAGNGGILG